MHDQSAELMVRNALNILPAAVRPLAILGGGAFRSCFDGTPVKDFDIFFRTHEDWLTACHALRRDELAKEVDSSAAYPSFQYTSLGVPHNLIGFRHMQPEQLVESFDFTCCCMVGYIENGEVKMLAAPSAVRDARLKQLRLNKPQPICRFLKRAARYIEKYQYTITDELVARIPDCIVASEAADEGDY